VKLHRLRHEARVGRFIVQPRLTAASITEGITAQPAVN